jgi:membrane fusion protein, multidrug efflux system
MSRNVGKKQVGVAIVLLMLAVTGCRKGQPTEGHPPVGVQVQQVRYLALTPKLSYSGTVEASASVTLSFSIPGTVEQVLVEAGQKVRRGQLLATMNEVSYRSAFDLAQAKLEQAEDALKRFTPMHDNSSLPDIKFVEVETGVRQARATAAIAKKNLTDCRLLAPVDGVIGRRSVEPGMNALPGIPVLTLLQVEKLLVKIAVPENEIARIRSGQAADIVISALSVPALHGRVEEIGVLANPLSRCYDVKIALDNPDGAVRPGMVCNVELIFPAGAPELTVPRTALLVDESGLPFVYVVDASGKNVSKRPVTAGSLVDEGICIAAGLKEGEQVVVSGTQKLDDGAAVTVD